MAGDGNASSKVVIARCTTVPGPRQPAQVDPPEGPSQTEINARNQVELHATTLKYIIMKKDSRSPNTRDAYGPRQKEWREWCRRKRFADGELVTEAKMVTRNKAYQVGHHMEYLIHPARRGLGGRDCIHCLCKEPSF